MITASLWVPRGAAAAFPTKYHIDKDELARISKLADLQLEDAKDDQDDFQRMKNEPGVDTEDEDSDKEASGLNLVQSKGCVQVLSTRKSA